MRPPSSASTMLLKSLGSFDHTSAGKQESTDLSYSSVRKLNPRRFSKNPMLWGNIRIPGKTKVLLPDKPEEPFGHLSPVHSPALMPCGGTVHHKQGVGIFFQIVHGSCSFNISWRHFQRSSAHCTRRYGRHLSQWLWDLYSWTEYTKRKIRYQGIRFAPNHHGCPISQFQPFINEFPEGIASIRSIS